MPTFTVEDLLRNPEFRKLPESEQLKGLREVSPVFAKLPKGEQSKALLDPDFLPTAKPAGPTVPGMEKLGALPPAGAMPARPEYNIRDDKTDGLTKAGLYADEVVGAIFRPQAEMQAGLGAALETWTDGKIGTGIREQGEERAEYWSPRSEVALKSLADDPMGTLSNVDWWLNRGVETISQMVTFMAAGNVAGSAAYAGATRAGLQGTKAATAAEWTSAVGFMSFLETLVEGGQSAKEAYEQTGNRELAQEMLNRTIAYEIGPTAAFNAAGIKNPANWSTLKRVGMSMLSEAGQESSQGIAQRHAWNVTADAHPEANLEREDLFRDVPEEALIGGVFGGGTGGLIESAQRGRARAESTPSPRETGVAPNVEASENAPTERYSPDLFAYVTQEPKGRISVIKAAREAGVTQARVRQQLDALVEEGFLRKTESGNYVRAGRAAQAQAFVQPEVQQEAQPEVQPTPVTDPVSVEQEAQPEAEEEKPIVPEPDLQNQQDAGSEPGQEPRPSVLTHRDFRSLPANERERRSIIDKAIAEWSETRKHLPDGTPETVLDEYRAIAEKAHQEGTLKFPFKKDDETVRAYLDRHIRTALLKAGDAHRMLSLAFEGSGIWRLAGEMHSKTDSDSFAQHVIEEFMAEVDAAQAEPAADSKTEIAEAAEAEPADGQPKLPEHLAGAKPRYGFGSKQFQLQFESDVDKASYIAAQKKRSRADFDYVKFAAEALGVDESEVRSRGERIRAEIKEMARDANPGVLKVPAMHALVGKPKTAAATETKPAEAAETKPGDEDVEIVSNDEFDSSGGIGHNYVKVGKQAAGFGAGVFAGGKSWGGADSKGPFKTAREARIAGLTALIGIHASSEIVSNPEKRSAGVRHSVAIAKKALQELRGAQGDEAPSTIFDQYRELLGAAVERGLGWRDSSPEAVDRFVARLKGDIAGGAKINLTLNPLLALAADALGAKSQVAAINAIRREAKGEAAEAKPKQEAQPKPKPKPKVEPKVEPKAQPEQKAESKPEKVSDESIAEAVHKLADKLEAEGRNELKDLGWFDGTTLGSTALDPRVAVALAKIGAAKMARGAISFAKWTDAMAKEIGEKWQALSDTIKRQIHDAATERYEELVSGVAAKLEVKKEDDGGRVPEESTKGPAESPGDVSVRADDPGPLGGAQAEDGGTAPTATEVAPETEGSVLPDGGRDPRGDGSRDGHTQGEGAGVSDVGATPPGERGPDAGPAARPGTRGTQRDLSGDYRLTDNSIATPGSPLKRAQANLEAIRTLLTLQQEQRAATRTEQDTLARYTGWGALSEAFFGWNPPAGMVQVRRELIKLLGDQYDSVERSMRESTLNAHYTRPEVIKAMWRALERMGIKAGARVLEPSAGIGHFLGAMPESLMDGTLRTGIELEKLTADIATALYPGSTIINKGYQEARLPKGHFDIVISNVPFGDYGVTDPSFKGKRRKLTSRIHDYFFAKAMEHVRPGGVVAFVTSKGTMDKLNPSVREYLSSQADLVGAVRLPRDTFADNAGTQVTTDIIFLRKREEGEAAGGESWLKSELLKEEDGVPIHVNEYFMRHPEMMLGEMGTGGLHGRTETTLRGNFSESALAAALEKLPADIVKPAATTQSAAFEPISIANFPEAGTVKDGALFISEDGKPFTREGDTMRPSKLAPKKLSLLKALLPVRDALRTLLRTQATRKVDDAALAKLQASLTKEYDGFVKKYGPISSRAVHDVYFSDPDYPLILSLEKNYDKDAGTAEKTDIFTKRTSHDVVEPTKVESVKVGFNASLAWSGKLDIPYIAQISGVTEAEVIEQLGELIFENPDGGQYMTAEEYLSGPVRDRLHVAEAAAAVDPRFERNVKALREVQPKDVPPEKIRYMLGAPWIEGAHIEAFALANGVPMEAVFSPVLGKWRTARTNPPRWQRGSLAKTELQTNRMSFDKLLTKILNKHRIEVFDTDSDGNKVANRFATEEAQKMAEKIQEAFQRWVLNEPTRAQTIAKVFNDTYNNLAPRKPDGSHLVFPGMNKNILRKGDLDPHQKNAVWRVMTGQNVALAHVVGAGKTFEMVTAAMELKRIGRAKKPMVTVPNHLVAQFSREALTLFPGANIAVLGKADFAKENRRKAVARIATGNYDMVVISHASFERIGVSLEREVAFNEDQIEEVLEAIKAAKAEGSRKTTVKQLEAAKKKLEERLNKLLSAKPKDQAVMFEELGVDWLFVDEAHMFKNLPFHTSLGTMRGLSRSGSQRAMDMYLKSRYIQEIQNGGGVTFASGTLISNQLAEMFTLLRYLAPKYLEDRQMTHFDAWAATFAVPKTTLELTPAGKGFAPATRIAEFVNVPEMVAAYRDFADIQTAEMLNLPTPEARTHIVKVKPTKLQEAYVDKLLEDMRTADPTLLLSLTTAGRKAAMDIRSIVPALSADPQRKAAYAIKNIFEIWTSTADQRSTQLVFADLSTPAAEKRGQYSIYRDIKEGLVKLGVPANEVAYIHDYTTDEAKQELFDQVNSGRVRVLIGSTPKMGAGTNVQQRLIALHHIDTPWKPSDVEQRDGRGVRPGNQNKQIDIYRYVTEGTFDAYMWQAIVSKAKMIASTLSSPDPNVRSVEDEDTVLPDANTALAAASGDPRVKDMIEMMQRIQRLDQIIPEAQNARRMRNQYLETIKRAVIPSNRLKVENLDRLLAGVPENLEEQAFKITVGGEDVTGEGSFKTAGEKLVRRALERPLERHERIPIGDYLGIELVLQAGIGDKVNKIAFGQAEVSVTPETSPVGLTRRIRDHVENLRDDRVRLIKEIAQQEEEIKELESLKGPLPEQLERDELQVKRDELVAELGAQNAVQPTSEKWYAMLAELGVAEDPNAGVNYDSEVELSTATEEEEDDDSTTRRPRRAGQTGAATLDFLTMGLLGNDPTAMMREIGAAGQDAEGGAEYWQSATWTVKGGVLMASPAARDLLLHAHDQAMLDAGLQPHLSWRNMGGVSMPAPVVAAVLRKLADIPRADDWGGLPGNDAARAKALELGEQIMAMTDGERALPVAFQDSREDSAENKHAARHELFHSEQFNLNELAASASRLRPGTMALLPGYQKAKRALLRRGYENDPAIIMLEIPAHIAAGEWESLGLSREEARELLVRYIQAMQDRHGFTPVRLAAIIHPSIREQVKSDLRLGRTTREEVSAGDYIPRPSEAVSVFQRRGDRASDSGGRTEGRARSVRPLAPGGISKQTIKRLRTEQRKLDWTDERYSRWLQREARKISTTHLTEEEGRRLLDKIITEPPAGLGPSAVLGMVNVAHSPSFVLGRSAAGTRIFDSAEKNYFRQERLVDRFTRNYRNAVDGLDKPAKRRVMIYRFVQQLLEMHEGEPQQAMAYLQMMGEDAALAMTPDSILRSDAERRANRMLTIRVFEPTRKIGVEMGLLEPGQKFNDYLGFYSDSYLQRNKSLLADAAAALAQEMGISHLEAMSLMEEANTKSVRFGSFDFSRSRFALPMMNDLERIAEIYVKGFARKIAITSFLTDANPLLRKIADPGMKSYAKRYIAQYAGRPAKGTEMMDAAIKAIPWMRDSGITATGLAGYLTAIQFAAKIGGNLFTPILNLTQTPLNTAPKYGVVNTAKASARAISVLTVGALLNKSKLPKAQNPFIRDMVKLRDSGILDSLSGKFERPAMHGWPEDVTRLLTSFFTAAENFNRATAYMAGQEWARRNGLKDVEKAGRAAVRITQFFSGRLDAPLFARTPVGRVIMQFKTFPIKQLEFMRTLGRHEAIKFALANVLLGGFGSMYIRQALNAAGPDWEVTEWVNRFDDSFSVAALLHYWKLADQLGVKQVPGTDKLGERGWTDWTLRFIAGPSIMAMFETVQDTARLSNGKIDAGMWMKTLIRAWAPSGIQINRAIKAMETTQDPWERMEIMLNLGDGPEAPAEIQDELKKLRREMNEAKREAQKERRDLRRQFN